MSSHQIQIFDRYILQGKSVILLLAKSDIKVYPVKSDSLKQSLSVKNTNKATYCKAQCVLQTKGIHFVQ